MVGGSLHFRQRLHNDALYEYRDFSICYVEVMQRLHQYISPKTVQVIVIIIGGECL